MHANIIFVVCSGSTPPWSWSCLMWPVRRHSAAVASGWSELKLKSLQHKYPVDFFSYLVDDLIYVRLATVVNAVCVLADSRFGGQQDWPWPEENCYNQGRTGFCSEERHGLLWNIGSKYSCFTNQTTCSSVVQIALNSCIDWYLFVYRKTAQMLISHFSIYQNSTTPCIRTRSNILSHLAEQLYKDLSCVKYSYRFTSIFVVIYGNSDLLATAFTMSMSDLLHTRNVITCIKNLMLYLNLC